MAKRTKAADSETSYFPLSSDSDILAAAEQILMRKCERGELLTVPARAGHMFRLRLASLEHEVFSVAFLDNRHRVIAIEDLFRGTIDGAEVYPREVAKAALKHNAAAVILAHNHPSGSTEPSSADRAVTLRLKDALAMLEIRVLDHFVVSAVGYTSLAARGWV